MIEHFAKIVRGDEPPPNFLYETRYSKGGLHAKFLEVKLKNCGSAPPP